MRREAATILLNKLVDDQILEAKEEVEMEIEKTITSNFEETKEDIMHAVELNKHEQGVQKEIEKVVDEKLAKTRKVVMREMDVILGEKILTGREAILDVLEKAAVDTDFMAELAGDYDRALRGYGLTSEEKAALASGDIRRIEEWVGELTRKQSKWLWARLQQEKW